MLDNSASDLEIKILAEIILLLSEEQFETLGGYIPMTQRRYNDILDTLLRGCGFEAADMLIERYPALYEAYVGETPAPADGPGEA